MDIKPAVSIIIPTHKGRNVNGLRGAIATSTFKDYEIIVVDEGKERSAQRNIGIDRAKGEYLLILDSDMYIAPNLLADCVHKIQFCNGVYLREKIITKGWFAKIRNWERQFYTGSAIDVVRFVRRKGCPRFDESMSGPEDSDWERQIPLPKLVSDAWYWHCEDVTLFTYLKKKAYYAESMARFIKKHPHDKILDWKWRCFGVFLEDGKWRRFLSNPPMAIAVLFFVFVRGIIYLVKK